MVRLNSKMLLKSFKNTLLMTTAPLFTALLLLRSSRSGKLFNGDADPMGAGGDGALESDSNFIASGEEAVFNSP
jgi:hypothetical protein